MNNARRARIRRVIKAMKGGLPDWDAIEVELNDLLDEEQEAMDNIPESLQDSDRYYIAEESVEYLEDAVGSIDPDDEDAAQSIIDILEQIDGV